MNMTTSASAAATPVTRNLKVMSELLLSLKLSRNGICFLVESTDVRKISRVLFIAHVLLIESIRIARGGFVVVACRNPKHSVG